MQQNPAQQRCIETQPALLTNHVGLVTDHEGHAPFEQGRADLSQWVRGLYVNYVGRSTKEGQGLPQAERHTRSGGQPALLDNRNAI